MDNQKCKITPWLMAVVRLSLMAVVHQEKRMPGQESGAEGQPDPEVVLNLGAVNGHSKGA